MKKFLVLMLMVFVSLSSVALAKKPIKIARLPIIIQKINLDSDTSATLEMKMARAVKIPLNQTLKIAEYIPPKESARVFGEIWQEMYAQDKKSKLADAVKIFADEMDADLVICPVLRHYSQRVSPVSFSFETHLSSDVSAELIIYDKSTGDLLDKKISRSFSDNYSRYGTASYLAGECFDKLIEETKLREIIRSKKN